MADSARLFIAVKLAPPPLLRELLSRLRVVGRAVKAVHPDNLHLTLKFLGDTDLSTVPQISSIMEEAVGTQNLFSLDLAGLGVFPNRRRPAVVWVGMRHPERLITIASVLSESLEPLGFVPERRAHRPHVTVARIRHQPPEELGSMLETERETNFGTIDVEAIALYQSELRSDGARYTVLSRSELQPM